MLEINGTNGNRYGEPDRTPRKPRHSKRDAKLAAAGFAKPEPKGAAHVSRETLREPKHGTASMKTFHYSLPKHPRED